MRDYIGYFIDNYSPEKRGVSVKKDIDWWMYYLYNRTGKFIFIFLLVILFFLIKFITYEVRNNVRFPINNIKLAGDFSITNINDIKMVLPYLKDSSFFNLDINKISHNIELLPWIDKVYISRVWPNILKVNIVERIPAFRWGIDKLMDDKGHVFSNNNRELYKNLPQLSGDDGYETKVISAYNRLLEKMGKSINDLDIESFVLNRYLSWELHLKSGLVIKFGRDNFKERLSLFSDAYHQGKLPDFKMVDLIDLRYKKGFSVKWKKKYIPKSFKSFLLNDNMKHI